MKNGKSHTKAKRRVGRPRSNPRDKSPIVTNVWRAQEVTGIPIRIVEWLRDVAASRAFRHGKIYTGELLRDYKRHYR